MNAPLMLAPPSYVMSPKRLTMPTAHAAQQQLFVATVLSHRD